MYGIPSLSFPFLILHACISLLLLFLDIPTSPSSSLSFYMRLPRPPWITMGCGISTFNLMEEGMACGLKRRIVESPSKKDLLDTSTTSSSTKDNDHHHHARKASSDSMVMKEPPLPPQISEKERVERKKSRGREKGESDDGTDDDEYERGDDDDFGRRISDFDGNWIGSPSFREYCVDSESDQDAVNHGRGNGEDTEKKIQATDKLVSSKEVSAVPGAKVLEKKGSRGRKFIRVFPTMHKPKNLWHVTTCYSRNNHHVPTERLPEKEV